MKKTILFGLALLSILILAGCDGWVNPSNDKPASISQITTEKNFYRVGDDIDIMIEVANDNPVSFTPKLEVQYNDACFTSYDKYKTYEPIKPGEKDRQTWTLRGKRYSTDCNSTEIVTFDLLDAETSNLLDTSEIEIEMTK